VAAEAEFDWFQMKPRIEAVFWGSRPFQGQLWADFAQFQADPPVGSRPQKMVPGEKILFFRKRLGPVFS
jgi:hypothetical protein